MVRYCLICGKELGHLSPAAIKRGEGKYCGYKCSHIEQKGKKRPEVSGEKNHWWKGDNATINAIHQWVCRRKPKPELCEICNKRNPFQLSNISREYKRDIKDYEWLCQSCHKKKDLKMIREGYKPMEKGYFHKNKDDIK